jgi:hypothetical protein
LFHQWTHGFPVRPGNAQNGHDLGWFCHVPATVVASVLCCSPKLQLPGTEQRRTVEATPIVFRPVAAQPFDARCLSWQFGDVGRDGTVSIWTVAGRLRTLRLVGNPRHLLLLRGRTIGETSTVYGARDGSYDVRNQLSVRLVRNGGRDPRGRPSQSSAGLARLPSL